MHVITVTRAATRRKAATNSVLSAVPVGNTGETLGTDRQSCVRGRLFLREASGEHGRLGIDVGGSHAWREPGDGPKDRGVALRQLARARLEHRARAKWKPDDPSPEIERVDTAESLWGDSDDGERQVHDADRLSDHVRRSTEVRHPKVVSDHGDGRLDWSTSSGNPLPAANVTRNVRKKLAVV